MQQCNTARGHMFFPSCSDEDEEDYCTVSSEADVEQMVKWVRRFAFLVMPISKFEI